MAATFRTRPMLLATSRPIFSPSICTARGLLTNMEQARRYATRIRLDPRMRGSVTQVKKGQSKQGATSSLVEAMADSVSATDGSEMAVLSPGTFIPLPLSRGPKNWRDFLTYYTQWAKQRVMDRVQIIQQTFQLKEGRFWNRATFKAERAGVVDAALKLHAAMSRDLARGGPAEKTHLTKFCVPKLARSLIAAIEARPAGKRYEWERLELTGKPFWPRLVDHKWTEIDLGYRQSYRQAVVGIESKQRLTELDARGRVVGSKEMQLREFVVLWCRVDKVNRVMGDWQLYGTLKETTLEEMMKEKRLMKKMTDIYSAKKLQERRKKIEEP